MPDIVLVEGDNVLDIQLTPVSPPVANLNGVVTDANTGLPIQGVLITMVFPVEVNGLSTTTDTNGFYSFTGLAPGTYTIVFEKDGYELI